MEFIKEEIKEEVKEEMEVIKVKIEEMTDPEPSRIKHEDTEEQIGRCPFFILHCFGSCEITAYEYENSKYLNNCYGQLLTIFF